jgi:hypothetical protein
MASGRMPPASQGAGRPRSAPGPALPLLPPAHRAIHVRARPARHRRRPASTRTVSTGHTRHRRPARRLGRHRDPPRQRGRAAPRRPRPGQGQRPPSPPAPRTGHHADDRRRPPARLHLVPMAAKTSGPRPLPPLPGPAPGSTYMISQRITNRDCSTGGRGGSTSPRPAGRGRLARSPPGMTRA